MRHYKKGRKLGTSASHTKAIKKNLVCALFLNDRIKTIDVRAKEIRGDVDRIVTWAKRGDIHSRRLAIAALGDKELVREIFEKVDQGMFEDRNGGYSRILKLGTRKGDNANMVIMELVTEPVRKKKDEKPAAKKAAAKKAVPRKADAKKATEDKVEQSEKDVEAEAGSVEDETTVAEDEKAATEAEAAAEKDEVEAAVEEDEAKTETAQSDDKAEEGSSETEVEKE